MSPSRRIALGCVVGLLLVLACALGFVDAQLERMTLWLVQSLLALSLVVVWGRGGILSLGQSAIFGVGAYGFGVVAINLGEGSYVLWALLIATLVSAAVALVVGALVFYGKVSELNVAIITLALTLATYAILNNLADPKYAIGDARLGGYNGLIGIPLLRLGGEGSAPVPPQHVFILVGVAVVLTTAIVAAVMRSPFGRVVDAVRSNDVRAQLLGYDVRRVRLGCFVLGGAIAGWSGALFAATGSYASPGLFTLQPAVLVIIWVLVGGRSFLMAGLVGTFVVQGLNNWLGGSQGEYSPVYLGAALILMVLFAPSGLLGGCQLAWERLAPLWLQARFAPPPTWSRRQPRPARRAPERLVTRVHGLSKRFGGFTAVDRVDLEIPSRGIQCLIGPNGAGKSTLFALLAGTHKPSGGAITLGERRIERLLPHQRARLGIGIKTQTASTFDDLTVAENLWLAAYSTGEGRRAASAEVPGLLERFELEPYADDVAGELPHGRQQWLEIAMVAARHPAVLLLDEPTAGMTRDEATRTAELVTSLSLDSSVLVIEHDMHFVRELDPRVTVLHLGKVLAQGRLRELEASEQVRTVYLGGGHAHA